MSDIRSTIEQKVFDYVNKNKMIAPGDTIILGRGRLGLSLLSVAAIAGADGF